MSEATVTRRFEAGAMEKRKVLIENIAKKVMLAAAIALIVPVLLILAHIFYKASPVLGLDYLWGVPTGGGTGGGIWPPLIGTFFLVLVSLLICAPVGIMAGIYLSEYAPDNWLTRVINMAVTSLAGVPSIVHALFGVGAFVLTFRMGESLLAASCTIAVMTIPVLITSTREALSAVPMSFRMACWNMGATKWQTIRTIVLPNSISGILTGVILEVSRAAGETAPILFTGAAASIPFLADSVGEKLVPYYLGDRFMALSYHLKVVADKLNDVPEEMKYGTAAVLISLIFILNSFSIALRMYLRSRKKW